MKIVVRGLDPISAAMIAKRIAAVTPDTVTVEVTAEDDPTEQGLAPDTVVIRA